MPNAMPPEHIVPKSHEAGIALFENDQVDARVGSESKTEYNTT